GSEIISGHDLLFRSFPGGFLRSFLRRLGGLFGWSLLGGLFGWLASDLLSGLFGRFGGFLGGLLGRFSGFLGGLLGWLSGFLGGLPRLPCGFGGRRFNDRWRRRRFRRERNGRRSGRNA